MCDFFWQRLETANQGDLADIVRASGGRSSTTASGASSSSSTVSWQQQQQQLHIDQPAASASVSVSTVAAFPPPPVDDFGGLLHDLAGTSRFFEGDQACGRGGSGDVVAVQNTQMFADEVIKRPCSNLFSRVLQISPNNKPLQLPSGAIKPPPPPPPTLADHPIQISSPCTPGLKRRKSQAKKVVCIPAPAAASNRPSGEVVPSDLWAWRKYGQKPIKGSPYPRGYYRCSSSKGCSARKQVERSRTDPNMLVITYTSEHNHPWPTQRNALAGSTRSQPTKNNGASSASKTSGHRSDIKEEPNEPVPMVAVKEETAGGGTTSGQSTDDFFSDLAELDPDPMGLIFSSQEEKIKSKALDSFIDIFDWGGGSSFGDHQARKGL